MGNRVRFLEDQWMEGGSLKDQYPHIFAIAQQKGAKSVILSWKWEGERRNDKFLLREI